MFNPRTAILGVVCVVTAAGCGPLTMPMPARLEPSAQSAIDDAWDKAFAPADRLSSQALLDTLMTTQGYQVGVDRLLMRSEKRCAAGVIVMEIQFDRLLPAQDTFTVTLLNKSGKVVRHESYSREMIESAYQELFNEKSDLEMRAKNGSITQAQTLRLQQLQAREDVAHAYFPTLDED